MAENDNPEKDDSTPAKVKTVAASILTEYFDTLEKQDGLAEVAQRLRQTVLTEANFAEPSIRAALFPDVP